MKLVCQTLKYGKAQCASSINGIIYRPTRPIILHRSGLFNALFFGGMGRVSLKCHTPTQTAL